MYLYVFLSVSLLSWELQEDIMSHMATCFCQILFMRFYVCAIELALTLTITLESNGVGSYMFSILAKLDLDIDPSKTHNSK